MDNCKLIFLLIFCLPLQVFGQSYVFTQQGEVEGARDAFSRYRVSNPTTIFDAQFTYDLQSLLFEQITAESGASISHDATNRNADLAFSSTPTGGQAIMQSYEHFRYQPSKSQLIFITFNMEGGVTDTEKFAGYSNGGDGIEFVMDGTTPTFRILSSTSEGDSSYTQSNWNLDKMDGTGTSGVTLDLSTVQILVIDFQALYVGRVRIGFDIGGAIIYAHEFNHANDDSDPYFQTANLPIRVGMTCTGTVTTTMKFICSAVVSEGGVDEPVGYNFSATNNVTAGNGTDTHILSIQPKTTFNSIENRTKIIPESFNIMVTGNNPVLWKICVGQALTSTSTADVNATYSAVETISGTLSGSPSIVLWEGYIPATNQTDGAVGEERHLRIPLTLDAAGSQRDLGRLTLLVQGIGGTSATYAVLNWREVR